MWRVQGIFLFMCGVLAMHLMQQDWSVVTTPLTAIALEQPAAVVVSAPENQLDTLLANMTLEEKVGQLLMVGHWKQDYYQHTARLVQLYDLGGIIIMNVDDELAATVPTWTAAWQDASTVPLLISIDQEGGPVTRIRADGYTTVGQRDITTAEEAYAIGRTRGNELAALGINTNLAPVLDYASTSDAFLYDRSFASSSTMTTLAQALIAGHADSGVLAIPKHFPGHDSTPADSHFELPAVDITAADFPAYVRQFRSVLETQPVDALMTAHVQFPKLDSVYPTTLSEEVLSRQLRRELNFTGVIITDDMTMGAITNQWTTDEAAVRALQAGADMILFAAEPNAAISAHAAILEAVETGKLDETTIDESLRRILELKQTQGLL